jgi:hypothetical protein
MAAVAHHFREHPGLVWLGAVALMAGIIGIAGVESMDGGVGSTLLVLFAIVGAPFLIVGRLGVALTSWAPVPVQAAVVVALAIVVALLLDDPLRRLLDRFGRVRGGQS